MSAEYTAPNSRLGIHRAEVEDQDQAREETSEQVVVKADPEDFQTETEGAEDVIKDEAENQQNEGANRGIVIRTDLLESSTTAGLSRLHLLSM